MGGGKKQNKQTLGRALMKSRFTPTTRVNADGSIVRHTTNLEDTSASWTRFQSITQESDLEAFLNTAQLAGAEFTAERLNVQVISNQPSASTSGAINPFLLTKEQKDVALEQHKLHQEKLRVPRRPAWDSTTTPEQLKQAERESFLEWRRSLAVIEESMELLLTPYERNLEVWRQMWRVIERSDMIVQIVDARNPLLFRSTDVEVYVKEVDYRKKNLLLINKADMLTAKQRLAWAKYFDDQGIKYIFFSAALAKRIQEDERESEQIDKQRLNENGNQQVEEEKNEVEMDVQDIEEDEEEDELDQDNSTHNPETPVQQRPLQNSVSAASPAAANEEAPVDDAEAKKIHIYSVDELLDLFTEECPTPLREQDTKVTIGFIGYPNVGKSSTLNALCGAKRVAVASTPGKTKHFQTIHIPPLPIILCDCPGLVFPSFATTKADMVTNGILPIDQLREHTGPSALVSQRIPKSVLEKVYGIYIKTRDEEGVLIDRTPTAEEFLRTYAISRGYTKASQGNPDEARAARYILKDYVNGKLLFCFPPPEMNELEFNAPTYLQFLASTTRISMISSKILRQADLFAELQLANRLAAQTAGGDGELSLDEGEGGGGNTTAKSRALHGEEERLSKENKDVVAKTVGRFASSGVTRTTLFPTQRMVTNENGAPVFEPSLSSAKGKKVAMEKDEANIKKIMGDLNMMNGISESLPTDKKHRKGKKNVKQRTKWTADDY